MQHRITTVRIVAVMALMGWLAQTATLRAGEAAATAPGSRLRIVIANRAGAREADLKRARSAVAYELKRIDIDVTWAVEQRPGASAHSKAADFARSAERSLMLVLLSNEAAGKLARNRSDQLLGVALPPASRAYLFYGPIEKVARQAGVSIHEPLSYVMLHEIGHLLLSEGHAELGLMQATLPKLGVATFRQFTLNQEARLRLATRVAPTDAPVLTANAVIP